MHIHFIELGLWVSLPFLGFLLLKYVVSRGWFIAVGDSAITRFSLAATVGIGAWSLILMASLVSGNYNSNFLGYAGWTITVISILLTFKDLQAALKSGGTKKVKIAEWIFIAGLLVVAFFYIKYANENLFGGRDQGIYANSAIYIAQHGNISPDYSIIRSEDFDHFSFLPGLYPTANKITVQFSQLFPVWLAHAFQTLGIKAMFRVNAIFSVLSLILFRAYLQRFVGAYYSVIAALFLGLTMSQVWITRMTLTEILTQLLIMAALFTTHLAWAERNAKWAWGSGFFWGITALCRIDAFLFLPLLVAAHGLLHFFGYKNKDFWIRFYLTCLSGNVLSLLYYVFFSSPYFMDNRDQLKQIVVLLLVAILFSLLINHTGVLKKERVLRLVVRTVSVVLIVFFAYALLLRPYIQPYDFNRITRSALEETRTFRENTLRILGQYLSIPLLLASLGGWLLAFRKTLKGKEWSWLLPLITMGAFSVIYIFDPKISPDQYWAIRRFVPLIIPGFVFFGTYGLKKFVELFVGKRRTMVQVGLGLFMLVFVYRTDRPVLTFAENHGIYQQLSEIAAAIPDHSILLTDQVELISTPIFMSFDKKVVPLNYLSDDGLDHFYDEMKKSGSQFYLLSKAIHKGFNGYSMDKVNQFTVNTSYLEQKTDGIPRKRMNDSTTYNLYELKKESPTTNRLNFGSNPYEGVEEKGLSNTEFDPSGNPFRWTDGDGELIIPVQEGEFPKYIQISLPMTGPNSQQVTVKANGTVLFAGEAQAGFEHIFPLENVSKNTDLKIEIQSTPWSPAQIDTKSNDTRTLGVALGVVRPIYGDIKVDGTVQDMSSNLKLFGPKDIELSKETRDISIPVQIKNTSKGAWPSVSFLGKAIGSVRIGAVWYRSDRPNEPAAENRSELPFSLYPGDILDKNILISPVTPQGEKLPPGQYTVKIGLVQEGIEWFYNRGGQTQIVHVNVQ